MNFQIPTIKYLENPKNTLVALTKKSPKIGNPTR